jgi:hypothetical protein
MAELWFFLLRHRVVYVLGGDYEVHVSNKGSTAQVRPEDRYPKVTVWLRSPDDAHAWSAREFKRKTLSRALRDAYLAMRKEAFV